MTIDVFDVTGRYIRTIVDGASTPGYHTVTFDASGLASGTYLYRMQADNYVATRRMTTIK